MPIDRQILAKQFDISNQLLYIPILGKSTGALRSAMYVSHFSDIHNRAGLVKASVIIFLWRLDDPRQHIRIGLAVFFVFNFCLTVSPDTRPPSAIHTGVDSDSL